MDPALQELLTEGEPEDEVALILRLRDPAQVPAGIRVVSRFGTIITARAPRAAIPTVWADATVHSVKAPQRLAPDVELELESGGAEVLPPELDDQRRPVGISETGRGVVLGIVDWGIDPGHPDLRWPDGTTRLVSLWDQRLASAVTQPAVNEPYGYGRILSAAVINEGLRAQDPYAALGYHPADFDAGLGSHGTHTLSIAAGNGLAGGPEGIATEASIAAVSLGQQVGPSAVPLGRSHELLEALDFIFGLAGDNPCVVNLSLGRHAGDHTGRSLVEIAMDELLSAAPGRAIVQSCGNYFERRTHASWLLRPGDVKVVSIEVDPNDRTTNEVDIWYPGRDRLTIEVATRDGRAHRVVSLGKRGSVSVGGVELARIRHRQSDPQTGDHECTIFLEPNSKIRDWEITLRADDVVDGRVHAWIERDSGCRSCQSRFPEDVADPTATLGSIANGFRTIAVGAYGSHWPDRRLGRFSSSGTTRDGRQKPDLLAPGVMVLAARSATREGNGPKYGRQSGTSMAAPHVAGAVALMMEAAQRRMPIEETRRALLAACDPPPPEVDPRRSGSGFLNIKAALAAVRPGAGDAGAPSEPGESLPSDSSGSPDGDCGCSSPAPASLPPELEPLTRPSAATTHEEDHSMSVPTSWTPGAHEGDPIEATTPWLDADDGIPEAMSYSDRGEIGAADFETEEFVWHADLNASERAGDETSDAESWTEPLDLIRRILGGERDENALTNALFFGRHPELGGRRLTAADRDLAAEWRSIRDRLVRPSLQGGSSPTATPGAGAATRRGPLSQNALRQAWDGYACAERRMTEVRLLGWTTPVNPLTVDAWRALAAALERTGYRATRAWVYNCRPIGDTGVQSFHSYGLAIDIDARCNPNNRTPDGRVVRFSGAMTQDERCADVRRGGADTSFTREQIAAVESITTVDGLRVFSWGGRWRTTKDTMHFQIDVTPAELARGLATHP